MSGGTGEGNHMWNIVTMDDGKNYLVDVTNCDGFSLTANGNSYSWSSSVGFPDRLFLVGASGSVETGYTCTTEATQYTDPVSNKTITLSAGSIFYQYDEDQKNLWGTDILTLASENYTPPAPLSSLSNAEVTLDPTSSYTYNGTEHKPTVTVKMGETTLTKDTDYTVSYSNNTDAGAAAVTVTGKGDYTGSQTVEFTINPATPTIVWSDTSQTLTYTGEEANITAPTVTLVNSETFSGTINYSYQSSDTTSDFTSGLPTNAGTYTVKASIDGIWQLRCR